MKELIRGGCSRDNAFECDRGGRSWWSWNKRLVTVKQYEPVDVWIYSIEHQLRMMLIGVRLARARHNSTKTWTHSSNFSAAPKKMITHHACGPTTPYNQRHEISKYLIKFQLLKFDSIKFISFIEHFIKCFIWMFLFNSNWFYIYWARSRSSPPRWCRRLTERCFL